MSKELTKPQERYIIDNDCVKLAILRNLKEGLQYFNEKGELVVILNAERGLGNLTKLITDNLSHDEIVAIYHFIGCYEDFDYYTKDNNCSVADYSAILGGVNKNSKDELMTIKCDKDKAIYRRAGKYNGFILGLDREESELNKFIHTLLRCNGRASITIKTIAKNINIDEKTLKKRVLKFLKKIAVFFS